jgi:hypothetical protein
MKVTLQFHLIAMALAAALATEEDHDHDGAEDDTPGSAAPLPPQVTQKNAA